jgi:hypothetical protein
MKGRFPCHTGENDPEFGYTTALPKIEHWE